MGSRRQQVPPPRWKTAVAAGWGSVARRMWLEPAVLVGASPRSFWMQAAELSATEQGWPAGGEWEILKPGEYVCLGHSVLHNVNINNNQAERCFKK